MSTADPAAHRRFDAVGWLRRYGTSLFLVLLIVFFAAENPRFLSMRNVSNILTEVSIYGIIAVGMTFVILTAGVDLAVGSLLAFAGMAGAYVSIPPFIVTLGGLTVWRGATLILNDGSPIAGFDTSYRWWGTGSILGVPVPVVFFGVIALVGYVAQRYTRYGRYVYAVGGNPEAARLNGLDVAAIITSVYLIVGALAGLAGFLLSARLGAAEAVGGVGYELRVIASVVIGGASLAGGRGSIGGTVIGALLIGVLTNGLVIMHVSSYWQQVVIGLIIVAAVAFDSYAKSRRP
jgi:inositol transport system permease protein